MFRNFLNFLGYVERASPPGILRMLTSKTFVFLTVYGGSVTIMNYFSGCVNPSIRKLQHCETACVLLGIVNISLPLSFFSIFPNFRAH